MSGCYALIVAAGRGSRLGGDVPKQYRRLAGQPVLRRTVAAFLDHPAVSGVRVVIHPDDAALYAEAVAGLALLPPVHGGATRQDSVRLGLESLAPLAPERVLIHDAARPFIAPEPIAAAAAALDRVPGALVAVPVVDTIKRENGAGGVGETVDRRGLWRAQTPQAFRFDAILAAHRAAHRAADGSASGADLTDDAAVAERAGLPVVFVPGDEANFKITTEADLARAERALAAAAPARVAVTGTGFDVHAFETVPPFRDHVWLCGVKVPHARGLVGHSDADVALHALTDAVLGAVAEGDIGAHFSDRDPRWRGASSDRFLAHAVGLASAKGGRVVHLDVTIICEAPRVRPHHAAMVARVAAIAGLAPARVSVKGTTTERLGFTGRGEGIAAQAAATVLLPEPA